MQKFPNRLQGKPTSKTARALSTALVLLCIAFLFFNSAQSGEASGAASQQITAAITGQAEVPDRDPVETAVRKAGHLAEYGLLGLLLGIWLYVRHFYTPVGAAGALLCGHFVATLDECFQTTVPGRNGSVRDVWIDVAGLALGLLLAALVLGRRARCRGTGGKAGN